MYLFDQKVARTSLKKFFKKEKASLQSFGSRVNQTFEAYVFAEVIRHYRANNWRTTIVNPGNAKQLRLKFSTRGAPKNFSFCRAQKGHRSVQIRHQLRVSIARGYNSKETNSNICCDIVVLEDISLDNYTTDDALPNASLISFGEVKHMSAFAELVASFVGLVHELSPVRLKRIRVGHKSPGIHIAPFLYVSGLMYATASKLRRSIIRRRYDIDFYSHEFPMNS